MVLAHIGDIHGRFDVLADVVADVEQRAPDLAAWLVPGDVFDKQSTIALRNQLKDVIKRMADRAPVYGVVGNHDSPGDLDIFSDLGARYPIVFADTPDVAQVPLAGGDAAAIFFLPYPNAAGLLQRGVSIPDVPQAARQALEAIFIKAGYELDEYRKRGLACLAIGHCDTLGAVRGIGQPSVGNDAIAIDDALLAHLGDCPVLCNHIHRGQDVGRVHYAGSIARMSWGEIEPKSWSLVTCDQARLGTVGLGMAGRGTAWHGGAWSIRRVPIAVAPMYHCEARLNRDGVVSWKATAGPDGPDVEMPGSWTGAWVRLRAHYRQSEGVVLADAAKEAKALFADAERFEFEPVCEPDRAVRAPEVAAARTLAEKVQAWATVTGTVLPESVAEKLRRLETMDGDALVAEVEREITAGTPERELVGFHGVFLNQS